MNRYPCRQCGVIFQFPSTLKVHQMGTHDRNLQYACEWEGCGKRFLFLSGLKVHMRIHMDERPYQCSICPMRFRQLGHITKHTMRHGEDKMELVWEKCKGEKCKCGMLLGERDRAGSLE